MTANRVAEFDLAGWDAAAITAALAETFDRGEATAVVLHVDGANLDDPTKWWEFEGYPLPVVASVSSEAVGGPFTLALGADIRVAAEGARLGPGTTEFAEECWSRLTLLLGRRNAAALEDDSAWTADRLFDLGLVTALTAPGEARTEARRVAEVIASRGPIATRFAKEAIWRGLPQYLEQALRFETDLTLLLQTTKDRAEGVAAFLEKREPRFTEE